MAEVNDLIVKGVARFNGPVYNDKANTFVGTCSTAAGTAAKVIVIDDESFALKKGVTIAVKYDYTNTASNCTLNVNGTGAKQVWWNDNVNTGTSSLIFGTANRYNYYMYDGTYWVFYGTSIDTNDNNLAYQIRKNSGTYKAKTILNRYLLCFTVNETELLPTTTVMANVRNRKNFDYRVF